MTDDNLTKNMIDQNPVSPIIPQTPPVGTVPTPPNTQLQMGKSWVSSFFTKLNSKNLIIWVIAGFFVIAIFIIILGLLFGRKNTGNIVSPTPKSTPFILKTPGVTQGSGVLFESHEKLNKLKIQINELDPKQDRLKPPILNFNVRF